MGGGDRTGRCGGGVRGAAGPGAGRLRALLAGLPDAHAWPRPFERTATLARYAVGLGRTPPDAAALSALAAPWAAALPGVEVGWAGPGEVPDLP